MSEISSPFLQKVNEFWFDYYNAETTWYALYLPLSFWVGFFIYAKITKKDFGRWQELHVVHHVGALILGSLSLYYDDDSIVNERTTILWTLAYFCVDSIDMLLAGDMAYTLHGVMCIVLGLANYNLPLLRSTRMNSKAGYIETSTFFLYLAKRYRAPLLFGIFALVFTICRIIWIPCMMKDLLDNGMEPSHPVMIGVGLFYCLNIYWYIKIIKIALKGSGKKDDKGETKKD